MDVWSTVFKSGRKASTDVYPVVHGFDEQILLKTLQENVTLLISLAPIIRLSAADLRSQLAVLVPLRAVQIRINGQAELLRR
jgi:hypothetical protein